MGKILYITKVVDFYKFGGFNATVVVEEKVTCIIDGHGTNKKKILATDYKFQVEEEVEGSGSNWFLGKLMHRKIRPQAKTRAKTAQTMAYSEI